MIDNKDYNYTLIISGQNIQVIQHDTQRNLTYKHGLDVSCLESEREGGTVLLILVPQESQISQVGVSGDLRGATTSFRETDSPRKSPVAPPSRQSPVQSMFDCYQMTR